MGAVAVAVSAVAPKGVVAERCPAAKLGVAIKDAGVDDVGRDARARVVVGEGIAQRQVALVDAVETPGDRRLGRAQGDDLVRLDIGHVGVLLQGVQRAGWQGGCEAQQRRFIAIVDVHGAGTFCRGCGYLRFVATVIIPLSRPAIATVTVLHAIGIWNELILPTIYLTNKDYYPITRGMIVFQGVYGSDWPTLAAAVLIMTLPMLVIFLLLQRYIVSGLTAGAVKG